VAPSAMRFAPMAVPAWTWSSVTRAIENRDALAKNLGGVFDRAKTCDLLDAPCKPRPREFRDLPVGSIFPPAVVVETLPRTRSYRTGPEVKHG
jgi:hypothetical protein